MHQKRFPHATVTLGEFVVQGGISRGVQLGALFLSIVNIRYSIVDSRLLIADNR